MGKYLVLWEMDQSKVPISPQERGAAWEALMGVVKDDIAKGLTKDWGAFVGELRGYSIVEGTEVEVASSLQQYVPFALFKVHPIATVEHVDELIKVLQE
ncbi:MAG: hypothetical protein JSV04_05385 [Candidatus Heimdallarchaeota archaeon]|nr:MAG: hypothetical protein JSV04_05385 [Candidatus Heimdallarchaeota archaeon]